MTLINSIAKLFRKCICQAGLSVLAKYKRPIVVHAELQQDYGNHLDINDNRDPHDYLTYLNTRPPSW